MENSSRFRPDRKLRRSALLGGVSVFVLLSLTVQFLRTMGAGLNPTAGSVLRFTLSRGLDVRAELLLLLLTLAGTLLAVWLRSRQLVLDPRNFRYSRGGEYGSAGLLDESGLRGIAVIRPPETAEGTIFGQLDDSGRRLITFDPASRYNKHVCVFGASRSGKTFTYAKPFILQCVRRRESCIMTDPKGELYEDSVSYFLDSGYIVRRLDLKDPLWSDGWNALGELWAPAGMDESGQTQMAVSELRAQIFASTVMENLGMSQGDGIYTSAPLSLLKALLLRVALGKDYEGRRTFGDAYDIIVDSTLDLDVLFDPAADPAIAPAIPPLNAFRMASANLHGNIITGLATQLQVMQNRVIKLLTGTDDIDLRLPGRRPCAYYVVLSDQHSTYNFLSSLFFSFLFLDLVELADGNPSRTLEVPVNFLLDEFANIGSIPDFDKKMATVASRNINVSIILQDLSQLENRYPTTWASIMSNCATHIGLGFNDQETSDYYAKRSGEATIQIITERTRAYEPLLTFSHPSSVGSGRRQVFNADELFRLDQNDVLLLFQNRNAMRARKYPVTLHPEYRKWKTVKAQDILCPITDTEGRKRCREAEEARLAAFEGRSGKEEPQDAGSKQDAGSAASAAGRGGIVCAPGKQNGFRVPAPADLPLPSGSDKAEVPPGRPDSPQRESLPEAEKEGEGADAPGDALGPLFPEDLDF